MNRSTKKLEPKSYDAPQQISVNLKSIREECGFTQAELAGYAEVTVETIARLERVVRGRTSANTNPSLTTLVRIANALGCGLDRLLGLSSSQNTTSAVSHLAWRRSEAERLKGMSDRFRLEADRLRRAQ